MPAWPVAQGSERQAAHRRVTGLVPVQGTDPGAGSVLAQSRVRRQPVRVLLSPIVDPSAHLPSTPSARPWARSHLCVQLPLIPIEGRASGEEKSSRTRRFAITHPNNVGSALPSGPGWWVLKRETTSWHQWPADELSLLEGATSTSRSVDPAAWIPSSVDPQQRGSPAAWTPQCGPPSSVDPAVWTPWG